MTRSDLDGLGVVVTGAASGIGAATARLLAERGAVVGVADITGEGARQVTESLTEQGLSAHHVALDVRDRDGWALAFRELDAHCARMWGLVNNAGITRDRSLLKLSDEDWDLVNEVNLKAAWIGIQEFLPYVKATGGSIVNVSSDSRHGNFGQANYAASKAGLVGLTRTVAIECGRYGVRCNAVAPGTADTPMIARVDESIRATWVERIPLGRFAEPEEVARAIAFLVSSESSYITGHVLNVDGGSSH